jgi:SAM-dependent methyltransferase
VTAMILSEKIRRMPKDKGAAPYSALAPIYDYVMDHVDYSLWAQYLVTLFKNHGKNICRVLDVSCGTGSLWQRLEEAGMTVYGCDAAWPMLKVAQRKLAPRCLWCGDIRHLGLRWRPQVVLSTYDSMNYLMSAMDWMKALQSTHDLLPTDGLFIFDISTLHNSKTFFQRYIQKESTPAGNYLRTSYYRKRNSVQVNEFKINLGNAPGITFHEVHRQKILALDTILEYIGKSEFELVGCYADFSFSPARENAERLHFVLKKAS